MPPKLKGFCARAFVLARIVTIIVLITITVLSSWFLIFARKSGKDRPPSLIATLVLTNVALLWSILSWGPYTKRYIPYIAASAVEFAFLVPFIVLAVLLGSALFSQACVVDLSDTADPSAPNAGGDTAPTQLDLACFGVVSAIWGLVIAVCGLFAVSTLCVGSLYFDDSRLSEAALKPMDSGTVVDGLYYPSNDRTVAMYDLTLGAHFESPQDAFHDRGRGRISATSINKLNSSSVARRHPTPLYHKGTELGAIEESEAPRERVAGSIGARPTQYGKYAYDSSSDSITLEEPHLQPEDKTPGPRDLCS